MSVVTSKTFLPAFTKTLGILFLYMVVGLFIDSRFIVNNYQDLQWLANLVMIIIFSATLFFVNPRIRETMFYAIVIGYFGEYLFSVALGMYTYRLENVPHYIPMGHALVYIGVLYFTKTIFAKSNRKQLEIILAISIITYATVFLIAKNDVFGFVMSLGVLIILRNKPRERLFYFTMYFSVCFLEIIGTSYSCWYWPPIAWDVFNFLPSHNPPSGISLFYFLLDLGCLYLYSRRHHFAWKRMKNIRLLKQLKISR